MLKRVIASIIRQAPQGAEWIHEIKLEGYGLPGIVDRDTARLRINGVKSGVLDMDAILRDAALGRGGSPQKFITPAFEERVPSLEYEKYPGLRRESGRRVLYENCE